MHERSLTKNEKEQDHQGIYRFLHFRSYCSRPCCDAVISKYLRQVALALNINHLYNEHRKTRVSIGVAEFMIQKRKDTRMTSSSIFMFFVASTTLSLIYKHTEWEVTIIQIKRFLNRRNRSHHGEMALLLNVRWLNSRLFQIPQPATNTPE